MTLKANIILLDLILLILSVIWISFSLVRGIDWIELSYVYVYFILVFVSQLLNLKLLLAKE